MHLYPIPQMMLAYRLMLGLSWSLQTSPDRWSWECHAARAAEVISVIISCLSGRWDKVGVNLTWNSPWHTDSILLSARSNFSTRICEWTSLRLFPISPLQQRTAVWPLSYTCKPHSRHLLMGFSCHAVPCGRVAVSAYLSRSTSLS